MTSAQYMASNINAALDPILEACWGDYRVVALASFIFLAAIKVSAGKRGDVDWYALVHALVISSGAILCVLLDFYASEIDPQGIAEPLRSVRCAPPLTRLHSALPMVSLGYAALDLFDGLARKRIDNILHGLILGLLMYIVCEIDSQHLTTYGLVMEISTVPLNFLKVKWSHSTFATLNTVAFVVSFFIGRIVIVPWLWIRWVQSYREEVIVGGAASCYPDYFFAYIYVGFGACFHALNIYWMALIVKGALRKSQGKEREDKKA